MRRSSQQLAHVSELIDFIVSLQKSFIEYDLTGKIGYPKFRSSAIMHPAAQASAGLEYPSGCLKSISGLRYQSVTTLGV
jgi:hypothetical protein